MTSRTQVTLDPELQSRAKARAGELGISFAEYVRRLVARDLAGPVPKADPTLVFDLGSSLESDVASDKDRMVAEAFSGERQRPS